MIAVDTAILIGAHRRGSPLHQRATAWLARLAEGPAPWAIPVFCIAEFFRVVTHPRVFSPPSTIIQASDDLGRIVASPTVRVLLPGQRFLGLFLEIAAEAKATGNLAFDAQIAAVCLEHGADRILTTDRDFRRFGRLRIVSLDDPLP